MSTAARQKRGPQEVSVNTPTRPTKKDRGLPPTGPSYNPMTPAPTPGIASTPRFSTTFKNHADKSYSEGVHKSRCPCIIIKELARELSSLDPVADRDKIERLERKIAELKTKGCSHGTLSKTVTREDINLNKRRVEAHTIHGKNKMLREVEKAWSDKRRVLMEDDDRLRSEFSVDFQIGASMVRKALATREDLRSDEQEARTVIEGEAWGETFLKTAKGVWDTSRRTAFGKKESRKRKLVEVDEVADLTGVRTYCDISHRLVRVIEVEGEERTGVAAEEVSTRLVFIDKSYTAQLELLALDETSIRNAIQRGETGVHTEFSTFEAKQRERVAIIGTEASTRRDVQAEEVFQSQELFSSASGGKLAAHCQTEYAARAVITVTEAIEFSTLILTKGEETKRWGTACEYYSLLKEMNKEYGMQTVSAYETGCFRQVEEVKAEEAAAMRGITNTFVRDMGKAVLLQQERFARKVVEQEFTTGLGALRVAQGEDTVLRFEVTVDTVRRRVEEEEDSVRSVLVEGIRYMEVEAMEAVARGALAGEEDTLWEGLVGEAKSAADDIFACVEDFRDNVQLLNSKASMVEVRGWGVPAARELRCATNCDLMGLLSFAISCVDGADRHWQMAVDKKEGDFAKQHCELVRTKGELSNTKEKLRELDTQYRSQNIQFTKLRATHQSAKTKVEALEREQRSTSAANNQAKLEKRVRELEQKLGATQNALDKERSNKRRKL